MADETKRMPGAAPTMRMPSGDAAPTKRMAERAETGLATEVRVGEWIDERYEVLQLLSTKGGEATVYLCRDHEANGREVVVKLYKAHFRPKREIVARLKGLKHEDIIQVFDFAEWGGRFYEVMEYARGGCVYAPGQRLDENKITEILHEINNALHFCHTHNIVHRDLKPTNFFYRNADKTDVVLGDFGISSIMEEGEELHATTASRTTDFAAPEVFHNKVNPKTDYYALGITILTLLKGQSPFQGWSEAMIIEANAYGKVPIPDSCSPRFQQLLTGLLTKTTDDRWGYEQMSRWLAGESVEVQLRKTQKRERPFLVGPGLEAYSLRDLAEMMHEHWERGREIIGRKASVLIGWVAEEDKDRAEEIRDAIEQRGISIDERLMQVLCWLDPARPYLLLPGYSARTPQELAEQIDQNERNWSAGREQLYSGLIPAWLRNSRFSNFATEWDKRKAAFKNQDQGLEDFLHLLKADLPHPTIEVSPRHLDFKKIVSGQEKVLSISVENRGRGYLYGSIDPEGVSFQVKLSTHQIEGNNNQITVTVKTAETIDTGKHDFKLYLKTNADNRSLEIPCSFSVPYGVGSKVVAGAGGLLRAIWSGIAAFFGGIGKLLIGTGEFAKKAGEMTANARLRRLMTGAIFGAVIAAALRASVIYNNPAALERRTLNVTGQSWETLTQRFVEFGAAAPIQYAGFLLVAIYLFFWTWRRTKKL
jgi:hypothetical protein